MTASSAAASPSRSAPARWLSEREAPRPLTFPPRSVDDVVYWAGWGFVASIPLLNAVTLGPLGTIGKTAGLPFGLLGTIAVASRGWQRRLHATHLLTILLTLWVGASYYWSIEPEETLREVGTQLQLLVMLLLLWEFADTLERLVWLLRAYVIGATGSLVGLLWTAATTVGEPSRYTLGTIQPNSLAFVLVLGIPASWYVGTVASRRATRLAFRAYSPLAVVGIMLTGSRSALIAGAVALTIVLGSIGRISGRHRGAVLVLAIAVLLVAPLLVPARPLERLATFSTEVSEGDLGGRETTWQQSFLLLADEPILGVGAGASRYSLGELRGWVGGVHNTYLAAALDVGVIGLGLFLLTLAAAVVSTIGTTSLERRFLLVTAATLVVGLLPRHWQYERPTWLIIAILVGMGTAATPPIAGAKER